VRCLRELHPKKQMGPALLPTPLSPVRGRSFPARFPANLPSRCSSAHLAPDVSSIHASASGFVTGARAGIRLHLRTVRSVWAEAFSVQSAPWAEPRPRTLNGLQSSAGLLSRSPFLPQLLTRSMAFPMATLAFLSNDPTCFRSKPSAPRLSKCAWTIATASLDLKKLKNHNLAALFFLPPLFRRQVEIAS